MKKYNGFKIGQQVVIPFKPVKWSSHVSPKCPLDLEYPFTGVINKIEKRVVIDDDLSHIAVNIGGYGFSLTHLIQQNNIKNATT